VIPRGVIRTKVPNTDLLKDLTSEIVVTGDSLPLQKYLEKESKLPGPRANLELANRFAETIAKGSQKELDAYWRLCEALTMISLADAPPNNPKEFLSFCGVRGLAAIGAHSQRYFTKSMIWLRRTSKDGRWRVREGVATGLQELIAAKYETVEHLRQWTSGGDPLELRAVAAALGEPSLMKKRKLADLALDLHERIVEQLKRMDRTSEGFKVLRQTLGYSTSVIALGNPEKVFAFLQKILETGDPDLEWIVRENLRKKRLLKNFPDKVANLQKKLESP
jgi:hypothetical protein